MRLTCHRCSRNGKAAGYRKKEPKNIPGSKRLLGQEGSDQPVSKAAKVAAVFGESDDEMPETHISKDEAAAIENEKSSDERSAFEKLPQEIKDLILSYMITATGPTEMARLYNATQNIRNLMMTNKAFKTWLDNVDVQGYLIKELSKRYAKNNRTEAAVAFGTKQAGQWLKQQYEFCERISVAKYLKNAAKKGHYGIVNFLVTAIPKIYVRNLGEALIEAAYNGHAQIVTKLLSIGAPVDARNELENTSLHFAAGSCKKAIVEILVNAGANVAAINNDGDTPLIEAVLNVADQHECVEIINLLLATKKYNQTQLDRALWYIASHGDPELIQIFLDAGANINTPGENGTPLGFLLEIAYENMEVQPRNIEAINLLLSAGVNVNAIDSLGHTALWYAQRLNLKEADTKKEIIDLLKKAGATE